MKEGENNSVITGHSFFCLICLHKHQPSDFLLLPKSGAEWAASSTEVIFWQSWKGRGWNEFTPLAEVPNFISFGLKKINKSKLISTFLTMGDCKPVLFTALAFAMLSKVHEAIREIIAAIGTSHSCSKLGASIPSCSLSNWLCNGNLQSRAEAVCGNSPIIIHPHEGWCSHCSVAKKLK